MKKISFLLLAMLAITSCKKDNSMPDIVGKWVYYQYFDGYYNGGAFQWHNLQQIVDTLIFRSDGVFIESNSIAFCGNKQYSKQNDIVTVKDSCGQKNINIYSLSIDTLIIKQRVDEGYILDKYYRAK